MGWNDNLEYFFPDSTINEAFKQYVADMPAAFMNYNSGASQRHTIGGHFIRWFINSLNRTLPTTMNPINVVYTNGHYNLTRQQAENTRNAWYITHFDELQNRYPTYKQISLTSIVKNFTTIEPHINEVMQREGFAETEISTNFIRLSQTEDPNLTWFKIFKSTDNQRVMIFVNRQLSQLQLRRTFAIALMLFDEYRANPASIDFIKLFYEADTDTLFKDITNTLKEIIEQQKDKNFNEFIVRLQRSQANEVSINDKTRRITDKENTINSLYNRINTHMQDLKTLRLELLALKTTPRVCNVEELKTFFKNMKNISLEGANNSGFWIKISTPLFNYIQSDVEMYYKHPERSNVITEDEGIAWMFKKAFIEHEYTLMITQWLQLPWTRDDNFDHLASQNITLEYPNPHIQHYNCFQSTRMAIYDAMEDDNIQAAVNIAIAAAGQITFTDTAVISKMVQDFQGYFRKTKCWKDKEGNLHSLKDLWAEELKHMEENE